MNKIGYPDKWRDYSTLSIVRGELWADQMRAHEFEVARAIWPRSASRWTRASGR